MTRTTRQAIKVKDHGEPMAGRFCYFCEGPVRFFKKRYYPYFCEAEGVRFLDANLLTR